MKRFKRIVVFLALFALPLAAAAATFSTESNEVETDVIFEAPVNENANANANVNTPHSHVKPESEPVPPPVSTGGTVAESANANANDNTNANIPPATPPLNTPSPISPPSSGDVGDPAAATFSLTPVGRAAAQVANAAIVVGTTVKEAAVAVNEEVIQNPQVQQTTNDIIAPATTVATAAVAASVNFPNVMYFFYFLFLQPIALLDRRRGKRTGVVYNVLNKLPLNLAMVRLIDCKTERVVRTRVTDHTGRFLFVVPESEYVIDVTRRGFIFPAPSLKNAVSDPVYADIYHGEKIESRGEPIAPNVPLEPSETAFTNRQVIQKRGSLTVKHLLASSTTVLCFVALAVSPNLWTASNFAIQLIVLAAVERYVLKNNSKKLGQVVNAQGKPTRAVIRLFETTYDKLVETMATDSSGRFAFLVGPNKYYVVAESDGKKIKSPVFDFSSGNGEMVIAPRLILS